MHTTEHIRVNPVLSTVNEGGGETGLDTTYIQLTRTRNKHNPLMRHTVAE
jgi:hypothetical protein